MFLGYNYSISMRLFLSLACLMIALTASHVPKSHPMNNVENATMSPEVKSLKDDIHTLEIRLQAFRNRQDRWNEGYLRLGLTTIVLATILGGLSLFFQEGVQYRTFLASISRGARKKKCETPRSLRPVCPNRSC